MISLTADYCNPLDDLLRAGQVPLDGLEFGPWFNTQRTHTYLQSLAGWKIYFHPADLLSEIGWIPGAFRRLQVYLALTGSPWASFHLTLEPPG